MQDKNNDHILKELSKYGVKSWNHHIANTDVVCIFKFEDFSIKFHVPLHELPCDIVKRFKTVMSKIKRRTYK